MNLREIWKEDTILDAGGNRSARRKPARASMDREPNSHTTLARLALAHTLHKFRYYVCVLMSTTDRIF